MAHALNYEIFNHAFASWLGQSLLDILKGSLGELIGMGLCLASACAWDTLESAGKVQHWLHHSGRCRDTAKSLLNR